MNSVEAPPRQVSGHLDRAAMGRFEVFLFSAIACVLMTRAFLAATGYPQVGGDGLHIAHVLWGGLLMGVGVVMPLVGMGSHNRLRAALVAGIGFGLFIDEIGKFLTKTVDYFYQPAVAIIYAVFVAFYLVVRELLRLRTLTPARRVALAATALSDQLLGELDETHRLAALALIEGMPEPAAEAIRRALLEAPVTSSRFEHRLTEWRNHFAAAVARLSGRRGVRIVGLGVIGLEIASTVLWSIGRIVDTSSPTDTSELGALLSSVVSALLMSLGIALLLRRRRVAGLRSLSAALTVDLLVTMVFEFASTQFGALVGFTIQLLLLIGVRTAMAAEQEVAPELPRTAATRTEPSPAAAVSR